MGELFVWWLALEVIGLVALPITATLFANLPDRGWALSKPLGLLLFGWLVWFPLAAISALPYSPAWIIGVFLVFAAGNALLLRRNVELRGAFRRLLVHGRGYIIASEALFAGAFAFMAWLRSFTPDVRDTEKFMDVAFLSSLWRAGHLPAPDPWLSGEPINYYYFGHFLLATLAKVLGPQPGTAFNIGIAVVFALAAVAVFGVAANIAAAVGPAANAMRRAIPAGLASALLVLVLGNLNAAQTWWKLASDIAHAQPARYSSPWAFWLHRDLWTLYDWWPPSRVIPNTINEFPAFSFTLADLHAHILALPFAALAVGLAFNLLLARGQGVRAFGSGIGGILTLLGTSIALGGLYALNGWDLPTYLGLALLALAIQQWLAHGRRLSSLLGFNLFTAAVLLTAFAFLAYLPFYHGFVSPSEGFAGVAVADRTPVGYEFAIFGLFIFILGSLIAVWLARMLTGRVAQATADAETQPSIWASLRGQERRVAWLTIGITLVLLLLWTARSPENTGWTLFWCALFILGCAALVWQRIAPAAATSASERRMLWGEQQARRAEIWVLCLVGTSAALVGVCELIFLRDIFGTRMNTVFKLYFQAWLLLGIACGPALAWLLGMARGALATALPLAPAVAPPVQAKEVGPALAFAGTTRAGVATPPEPPAPRECMAAEDALDADGNEAFTVERTPITRASQGVRRAFSQPNIPAALRWAGAGGILIWMACLVALVGAALIYPVLAASARTQNFSLPRGLDGTAYMATDPVDWPADCSFVGAGSNHGDNTAIAWLNTHVSGSPVIVEAPGCEWTRYSRISAFTGLPTLLGWPGGHEGEWRAGWLAQTGETNIFAERQSAINQIYTNPDAGAVLTLLRRYNVRYVYVGVAERNLYRQTDLGRFGAFLQQIYARDGVTIYAVPQS